MKKHKPPYQFAQFGAELCLGTTCWIESFPGVIQQVARTE